MASYNKALIRRAADKIRTEEYIPEDDKLSEMMMFLSSFAETFNDPDDDIIDPSGLGATTRCEPINKHSLHVLAGRELQAIDKLRTADCETWSFYTDKIHFFNLYDPDTGEHRKAYHWHSIYDFDRRQRTSPHGEEGEILTKKNSTRPWPIVRHESIGAVELVEQYIINELPESIPDGDRHRGQLVVIYAHNGEGFDWAALASQITSNTEIDPSYINTDLADGIEDIEEWEWYYGQGRVLVERQGRTIDIRRKGLWDSGSKSGTDSIHRIHYGVNPETGRPQKWHFEWSLKVFGSHAYIEIRNNRNSNVVKLMDSINHLPVPLAQLGAKGETPLQYTNPEEWLRQELRRGNLAVPKGADRKTVNETIYKHWKNTVTDEALRYCENDCEVLARILKQYQEKYRELVKHPISGNGLDPLSYLTNAQAGLNGMVATSGEAMQQSSMARSRQLFVFSTDYFGNPQQVVYTDADQIVKQQRRIQENRQARLEEKPPKAPNQTITGVPFRKLRGYELTACYHAWCQFGVHTEPYRHVQKGGRNEVFQPMNRDETRVVVLDAKSFYPSVMTDPNHWFPNPRFLKKVERDIVGRRNILAHVRQFGGVYLIESREPLNPEIALKFPVFPVTVAGESMDNRLIFPNWKGKMRLYVTREELRHFLELTQVKNDDIRVLAGHSLYTNLEPAHAMPFYKFVRETYKNRKEYQDEASELRAQAQQMRDQGDEEQAVELEREADEQGAQATIYKILMNAGSFGVLLQQNTESVIMTEGDEQANKDALLRMLALSPNWAGWKDLDEEKGILVNQNPDNPLYRGYGSVDVMNLAKRWCADHYVKFSNRNIQREGHWTIQSIKITFPGSLQPHAIRALGVSVAAYARVELHKALMAVDQIKVDPSETSTNIRKVGVLYCDTDSVHAEVPIDWTDEYFEQRLQQASIETEEGGRISQSIKVGSELGQWKIEPSDASKELKEVNGPRIRKAGLDPHQIDGFYLAPKNYYLTTKKDGQGRRYAIKDVVKTISKNNTQMRLAMFGVTWPIPRLGDPNQSVTSPIKQDLLQKIRPENASREDSSAGGRRSYHDKQAMSSPVTLQMPDFKGRKKDLAWIDVMHAIQKDAKRQTKLSGLWSAVTEFMETVHYGDTNISQLRRTIQDRYRDFEAEVQKEIGQGDDKELKRIHYGVFHKKLKDSGLGSGDPKNAGIE